MNTKTHLQSVLGIAVARGNFEWLAGYVSARIDVNVTGDELRRCCSIITNRDLSFRTCWADDTWMMWIKNRLAEHRLFDVDHIELGRIRLAVPMHIFFIYLDESMEMLRRLNYDESERHDDAPARSKISGTPEIIFPINRVAGRVV